MASLDTDTIAAIATPPGQGGIGIVRLSGPDAQAIAESLTNHSFKPRSADFVSVKAAGELVDEGIGIFFAGPNSFTGEDVVELQLHGSPVVLQQVLDLCREAGARLARPGEYTERAFLNDKIDLAQAEAVADLIASASQGAARAAVRSLAGEFSNAVHGLADRIEHMRMLIEATIDFPEEEEDFLAQYSVPSTLNEIVTDLAMLMAQTNQGRVINEGISVALIGAPNAGKSSLLNRLSGEEAAIVTDIPGTTRDLLKVDLVLGDLAVRLVDTAGLRETADVVEQEGVQRAQKEAQEADLVLCLIDATNSDWQGELARLVKMAGFAEVPTNIIPVVNKIDLLTKIETEPDSTWLLISAKTGSGIEALIDAVTKKVGVTDQETEFTARQRHVEALSSAAAHLDNAEACLATAGLELLAEELRLAHDALGEIVGKTSADDLLGRIFGEFCIGK